MIARLSRLLPAFIVVAVAAAAIYIIMSFRYSSNHAKLLLIKIFTWFMGIVGGVSLIITLYALFEHNEGVMDLSLSCLIIALVGLAITRICNAVFKKNHPNFGQVTEKATIVTPSLASRFGEAFKQAFGEAMKETFKTRRK